MPTGLANTKSLEITNAEDLEQGEHLANTVGNGDPWATLDKMWHHTEHCLWVNDSFGKVGRDCAANFYFHRTFKMFIIYDPRIPLLYMCTRKQVKKILSAAQYNGNYSKQPKCLAILLRKYIRIKT